MINYYKWFYISFLAVLIVFLLKWSNLYSSIKIEMILFFSGISILFILLSLTNHKKFSYKNFIQSKTSKNSNYFLYMIILLYIINFMYSREIPLINAIFGVGTYYKNIPMIKTLYPLLVSVSVFVSVYYFYRFISLKNNNDMFKFIIILIIIVLNMGRGILAFIFIPSLLIYISKYKLKINSRKIFKLSIVLISFLLFFGYLGNIRTPLSLQGDDSSERILIISDASEHFYQSNIPNEFYWFYIYIASPISNLSNFIENKSDNISLSDYLVLSYLPQSISDNFKLDYDSKSFLVSDLFNVSTAYKLPYAFGGYLGILIYISSMYLIFCLLHFAVRNTNYEIIYLSYISTATILSFFDNVIMLDVIYIPVFLSVILGLVEKSKIKIIWRIK
ncbi:MAG: O-antigen polymerase [Acholeplasma sp.]|nr:O-antigen polymerase [Acholeplasma sp.]